MDLLEDVPISGFTAMNVGHNIYHIDNSPEGKKGPEGRAERKKQ